MSTTVTTRINRKRILENAAFSDRVRASWNIVRELVIVIGSGVIVPYIAFVCLRMLPRLVYDFTCVQHDNCDFYTFQMYRFTYEAFDIPDRFPLILANIMVAWVEGIFTLTILGIFFGVLWMMAMIVKGTWTQLRLLYENELVALQTEKERS